MTIVTLANTRAPGAKPPLPRYLGDLETGNWLGVGLPGPPVRDGPRPNALDDPCASRDPTCDITCHRRTAARGVWRSCIVCASCAPACVSAGQRLATRRVSTPSTDRGWGVPAGELGPPAVRGRPGAHLAHTRVSNGQKEPEAFGGVCAGETAKAPREPNPWMFARATAPLAGERMRRHCVTQHGRRPAARPARYPPNRHDDTLPSRAGMVPGPPRLRPFCWWCSGQCSHEPGVGDR
jgi:hypothetical protein